MDKKTQTWLENVVGKFVVELAKRGIRAESILLYGSYARGNATKDSDVDLIVVSEDFAKIPPLERLRILSHAAWPIQAGIEALGYTPQEIAERGKDSIIWEAIQQNHKVLYKAA